MEKIETSIRKLKEVLGYEFDYDWSESCPPIKKVPENLNAKDKALLDVLDSFKDYIEEEIKRNNGFYY